MAIAQLRKKKVLPILISATLALSGLVATSAPASAADTKSLTITGFASNSKALTKSMKSKINKFVKKNSAYSFVTCVGFADRPGSAAANSNLGKSRAAAGCAQALKANSDLEIAATRGRWDDTQAGSNIRRVRIILSNSSTAQLTTYFEYMGGQGTVTETKTTAGGSLVLPTPTRVGYEFLGWFTDQYNGKKVGTAGESYTPTKTRILWAQWFVMGSAPEVNTACSATDPFATAFATGPLELALLDGEGENPVVPFVGGVEYGSFLNGPDFISELGRSQEEIFENACFDADLTYGDTLITSLVGPDTGFDEFFGGDVVIEEGTFNADIDQTVGRLSVYATMPFPYFLVNTNVSVSTTREAANILGSDLKWTFYWGDESYVFTHNPLLSPEVLD